jgi:hypothetical protein
MIKKLAIVLAVLTLAILAWVLFVQNDVVSVTINGRPVTTTVVGVGGVWAALVGFIVVFCVAILLTFVFVGVGLIILGVFLLVGLVVAAILFPFFLPLLIPLFIIWVIVAISRKP